MINRDHDHEADPNDVLRLIIVKLRDVVEKIEVRQREIASSVAVVSARIESVADRVSRLERELE